MELEIKEEKENPFFERKELKIELKHSGATTPSKQELIKELVSKYSVPEENILIDYIFTKKGISESIAKVKIYKKRPKIKKIKEKKVKKEEKKPEEKPKKEKKEVESEAQTSEAK